MKVNTTEMVQITRMLLERDHKVEDSVSFQGVKPIFTTSVNSPSFQSIKGVTRCQCAILIPECLKNSKMKRLPAKTHKNEESEPHFLLDWFRNKILQDKLTKASPESLRSELSRLVIDMGKKVDKMNQNYKKKPQNHINLESDRENDDNSCFSNPTPSSEGSQKRIKKE